MEANRPNNRTTFTPLETVNRTRNGRIIKIAIIAGALFAVITITVVLAVVIPMQISTLEYYEYGLKREKSTGIVLLDKVYTAGKYWLGQDYDFFVYQTDAYHLNLENVITFSKERLEIKWDLRMQYFIRGDEVTNLYRDFNITFADRIKEIATHELKVLATTFSITDRTEIERSLYKALRRSIGGQCCRLPCNQTEYELACFAGCITAEDCSEADKGLHVDVKHVQLGMPIIPDSVLSRFVLAVALPEQAKREQYLQEAIFIRRETDMLTRSIKMETDEITANATSQCDIIINYAKSDYISTLEQATIKELQSSIKQFNITEEEKTAGLEYLQTLINQGNFRPNITFIRDSACN